MTATVTALIVAHQGGWDEILLVLTPIALFVGLLYVANRRADAILGERDDEPESDTEPDTER